MRGGVKDESRSYDLPHFDPEEPRHGQQVLVTWPEVLAVCKDDKRSIRVVAEIRTPEQAVDVIDALIAAGNWHWADIRPGRGNLFTADSPARPVKASPPEVLPNLDLCFDESSRPECVGHLMIPVRAWRFGVITTCCVHHLTERSLQRLLLFKGGASQWVENLVFLLLQREQPQAPDPPAALRYP